MKGDVLSVEEALYLANSNAVEETTVASGILVTSSFTKGSRSCRVELVNSVGATHAVAVVLGVAGAAEHRGGCKVAEGLGPCLRQNKSPISHRAEGSLIEISEDTHTAEAASTPANTRTTARVCIFELVSAIQPRSV